MKGEKSLILVCVCLVAVYLAETNVDPETYLRQYGYIKEQFVRDTNIREAILSFQKMFNIELTGEMDEKTYAAMQLPRCGHHDQPMTENALSKRIRRYLLLGTIWHHMTLTYKITKFSKKLPKRGTRAAARKAFNGVHGDNSPFDGPRKQLAHAFQPEDGRSHFDDAEQWVLGSGNSNTFNIMQVMTHEFGHLMGMGHSRDRKAVMTPYYRGYDPNFALGTDDIRGIRAMYGPGHGVTTTPAPTMPGEKEICDDPSFDAVTMADDWRAYGFKGSRYYRMAGGAGEPQAQPLTDWNGPSTVDAVLGIPGVRTLLFKGSKVYAVRRKVLMRGYPRRIISEFPGLPRGGHMAAAFMKSGKAYFRYSDGRYFRSATSSGSRATVTSNPFRGRLPSRIDGIFTHPNYFSFAFSGRYYYRISISGSSITRKLKNTSYWVKCKRN